VDNGTLPSRRGSINVDDEGSPTQNTVLIEKGILKGYLSDKLSARLMKCLIPAMDVVKVTRTFPCRA